MQLKILKSHQLLEKSYKTGFHGMSLSFFLKPYSILCRVRVYNGLFFIQAEF